MESMIFQVSAKTARLIGRENISDVDGAIIELVKNGYDADAECVFVKYNIPFANIPQKLSLSEVNEYFQGCNELIEKYYIVKEGEYELIPDIDMAELDLYIKSLASIIVLDNGSGMTRSVLQNAWMNIGTDDKEKNIYSKKKNRVKTGAKGIGRFALDKLSLKTLVYTRAENDTTYEWRIDWQQFEKVELLNQVEASLNRTTQEFEEIVKAFLGEEYEKVKAYSWNTGTMIVLSPIRTFWTDKLFMKVNANLKNINPLGCVDKFDVLVCNSANHDLDYAPTDNSIDRTSYDYCITASYDGEDTISVTYDRNEINIGNIKVTREYSSTDVEEYDIEEFWSRDAFSKPKYMRNDYDGEQSFVFSLNEIITEVRNPEEYKGVGPFSISFYYLKNSKSTVEIIKDFPARKRKKMLDDFSGIKLYRDSFKVRPYGDQGQFYDWLNLSERVQLSPAAASHRTGKWRVSPYQLIGSVAISRMGNPNLQDNANREGMSLNREYDCFIELIQGILSKFEYDRQYILREYAAWIGEKERAHATKVQEVYEQLLKERENKKKGENEQEEPLNNEGQDYSKEELKNVIISLGKEKEKKMSTEQVMNVLSASGVLAQTFSHEITRMETDFGSRGQQLKATIDVLLDYKPYSGDEDFNPYDQIKELDETDLLLSEWVGLIMSSIGSDKFDVKDVNIVESIEHIRNLWIPLLKRKYIDIEFEHGDELFGLKLPEVDIHLILNNFILNSAYYLEDAEGERQIVISLYREKEKIVLDMKNNGPALDERYRQTPDETLEARETSKKDGTGLGLWIANGAVIRNDGELHVIPLEEGYLLRASWKE